MINIILLSRLVNQFAMLRMLCYVVVIIIYPTDKTLCEASRFVGHSLLLTVGGKESKFNSKVCQGFIFE